MSSETGQSESLVFGTDGWRAVIADGFTFSNLRRAAQAYAEHLLDNGGAGPVLVGYDTRFSGRRFALEVAGVLRSRGLDAMLSADYLPTPALSFAVKHHAAAGGVMITASHNPPAYSGFKLKGPYGGTATEEIYRDVARRVRREAPAPVSGAVLAGIEEFDVRDDYYRALAQLVDLEAIREADVSLVHDPMGGAGCGWLKGFATATEALRVEETRGKPDPLFYGVNPEPIPANLQATRELLEVPGSRSSGGPLFAVATDGDGDRLGVVLPGGAYFNSHQIFAVLLDHLARRSDEGAGAGGTAVPQVVKTFTVSRIIERLARRRGLEVVETPVGFKYIVDAMLPGPERTGVLIGGEESGGIGIGRHLPERDGLANALLLVEAVVAGGRSLAEVFTGLEEETAWRHAYDRRDLHLTDTAVQDRAMARLADPPDRFGDWRVVSGEDLDGVKLNLAAADEDEASAWLLFRASGTEPVLRVYCEAPEPAAVTAILEVAEEFVRS